MPDNEEQFDPANPDNKAITDGMERDGETLRDIRDGKTPTEQVYGLDLGTDAQELVDEHESMLSELGQVVAEEAGRTATPEADASPVEVETPEVSPDAKPGPVAQLQAEHGGLFQELGTTAAKAADNTLELFSEPQPDLPEQAPLPPMEQHRLQSEHGKAFVEMQETVEKANPLPEPEGALPPDVAARIAHPGKEKQNELANAVGEFAQEDKLWRAAVRDMFKTMAEDIVQHRLELERMRGELERGRL